MVLQRLRLQWLYKKRNKANNENNIITHPEFQKMKKRIDALEIELKQMKKILRNNRY